MSRNNHASVLSNYDYEEPLEPTRAIRRLRGISNEKPVKNYILIPAKLEISGWPTTSRGDYG